MTRRLPPVVLALTLMLSLPTAVSAQQRPPADSAQDFARYLFPPELIMQHQQKIGLRPEQRTAITQEIQKLQSTVIELQWKMQDETQRLSELMQQPTVKEADALAQIDRVLAVEREIKRAHITMLIRIKNTLTREQQATLATLR